MKSLEERIADLEDELRTARDQAIHWEREAKELRRENMALRRECDTSRIARARGCISF